MRFTVNSLKSLPPKKVEKFLTSLSDQEAAALLYDWRFWSRDSQQPPDGDWTHWLLLAGRGFGKTRTGAEWVRNLAENGEARRIALVAPTASDARHTMVEGESGLLAIAPPWCRPAFNPSKRQLRWPNGAVATLFSAEEPERLRGPQHDAAWCDELCAWRHDCETWDMLMMGLRLGSHPRTCITTTPKPTDLIRGLLDQHGVHVTRGTTFDNLDNLAPTFQTEILNRYEGTRLGRQELFAELLEDVPGALWNPDLIDQSRMTKPPEFEAIVVALDPPATSGENADACGIIVAARTGADFFVIDDKSEQGLTPFEWAERSVQLYHHHKADHIVAETNQGGDMVTALMRQVDPCVPVRTVFASRGKITRAEPVAALYEQGRVHHIGHFPALEDQMCRFTGAANDKSPDRLDALVWAITDLMSDGYRPTLRQL